MMSNNLDDAIDEMMCDFAHTVAWFCGRGYQLVGSEYGSLKWKRPDGETVALSRQEMEWHRHKEGRKERQEAEERSENHFESCLLEIVQGSPYPVTLDHIKRQVQSSPIQILFNGWPKKADERDVGWKVDRMVLNGKLLVTPQGEYTVPPVAE
jgi:hypothetical protein